MKKQPQRSCVACRACKDKKDLLRVVAGTDGVIKYDPTGKAPGRGAYLCRSEECIKAELKKCNRLSKGLRRALTSEEIDELTKEMLKAADV